LFKTGKSLKKKDHQFDMIVNAKVLTDKFGVIGYPLTLVVDKDKVIRYI
jgi:hypothetical protein